MGFVQLFAQPKQDHNQLTPTTVQYVKIPQPFEQKITFGIKTYVGFNSFGASNVNLFDLKPQFGVGIIGNFRTHHHVSMRHELLLGYSRYIFENVNYSISYPWIVNYHFKQHAYINLGLQPGILFMENNYIEKLTGNEGVSNAFEVSVLFGVEYPVDDDLDFGIRVVKSLNGLFKTDLPDYNGAMFSFSYYWHRFSSSERKLMNFKRHKSKSNM